MSVVPVKLAASQEATCDPFEIGTDMEKFTKALASPILDPNSCLCKSPCTPDKVEEFVRFYYMKKYICSSRFPVNIWIYFKKIHFFSGKSFYRRLNVENPKANKLYNYKGPLKFLFHGYSVQGTKG